MARQYGVASRIPVDGSAHVTGTKSTHCGSRPDLRLGKFATPVRRTLCPLETDEPRLYCVYTTRRTATRWCAVTQHGRVWVAAIEGELHDTIHKVDASYSKHVRDTFPQFPSRLAPRRRKRYRVQSTVHTETAERSCGRHPCPRPVAVPRPHTIALESARAECSAARQALPPVAMSRHAPFKAQSSFKWYSRPAPSPSAHHCTLPIEEPLLTAPWGPPC